MSNSYALPSFFFLKNCIESSMSSASSMAIRQFHSWSDRSKTDPKTQLWCEHCKRPRHTIDTCWHIHDSSSSTNLSPVAVSNTTMCIVAQQGISIQPNIPWKIDLGASDHMTGQSQLFHSYMPSSGLNKVRIADGSFSPIAGKGEIALTPTLTLNSLLHVPKLSCNLFSVSKFTQTNNCVAKFSLPITSFRIWVWGRRLAVLEKSRDCIILMMVLSERNKFKWQKKFFLCRMK